MTIRQAEIGDAKAIATIWNSEIRDSISTFNSAEKTEAEVAEMIAARGPATQVAVFDGEVVGFVTYGQFRGGVGYRHSAEHTIYLATAARGRGLGPALMSRIEEVARDAGYHVLVAGIAGENTGAVGFHQARGFTEVGRMVEVGYKFGRWMDLILMQKIL